MDTLARAFRLHMDRPDVIGVSRWLGMELTNEVRVTPIPCAFHRAVQDLTATSQPPRTPGPSATLARRRVTGAEILDRYSSLLFAVSPKGSGYSWLLLRPGCI
jgi:hypothetical protein